jgi:stage II sporulation protein D
VKPIIGDIMIQNYKITNINNEEVLIIYLDYNYEFGKIGEKGTGILDQVKKTINAVNFTGKTIILVAGTIAIATLLYTDNELKGNIILENNASYLSPSILEKNELFSNKKIEDMSIDNNNNNNNIETEQEIKTVTDESKLDVVLDTKEQQSATSNQTKTEQNINTSKSIAKQQIPPSTNYSTTKSQTSTSSQPIEQPKQTAPVVEQTQPVVQQPAQTPPPATPTQPTTPVPTTPVAPANMITVYRSNGTVLNIELEDYLVGVVAAEIPASFNVEALKAQAIVARTYTLKRISRGLTLGDTAATQEYKDINQMKTTWQGDFQKYYDKIKSAVDTTKGKYITYGGTYIDAVYHSTSNGYTEDSVYVWGNSIPYLKSVDSSWDKTASSYLRTETKDYNTILSVLGISISADTPVEVLSRNASGRIISVRIGDSTYTGVNLRNMLGLRSADFDIVVQNGNLVFTTRGYGHGVGMSQYGANGMANSGYNYAQIITHYYQGVQIAG